MLQKVDLSISFIWGNVLATLLSIPVFFVIVGIYTRIWGIEAYYESLSLLATDGVIVITLLIIGIVIHEAIHGLTWQWTTKEQVTIEYGFKWAMLTPYAHLKDAVPARAYRIGVLMPGFVLGLVPLAIAFLTGDTLFFWFGLIFTIAACGDLLVLWVIRRVPPDDLVEDHPQRIGCYVYLKDNKLKDSNL